VHSSGEENGGSTFFFTLPVLQTFEPVSDPLLAQTVIILTDHVIESNGSNGSDHGVLLQKHLVQAGFQAEVWGMDDTPDWLARVLATPAGAVILDVPVSERGWELMGILKNNPGTQDIPVIYYSVLQEQSSGSILSFDYLSKPVPVPVLNQVLEKYGLEGGECSDPRTVLVVDDDPGILEMHAQLVEEHVPSCRVLRASNGRIALELMRQKPPSLVLLDLMMPEMDGTEVLKAMQADARLRDVPVIVLTAQTLTQEDMVRLNRGVAAVLAKGVFTAQETLAHIEQTLSRSKRLGSETQRLVRKAMAYIHEHYPEPISREELAAHTGVSERHLNRCFLQETGMAPIAYLNRFRIQKAKCLLKENDRTITDVMGATGFSDSSYFTRVFRREVGQSPSEFQRGKKP
jgi:CheY-like chemotaxis protein